MLGMWSSFFWNMSTIILRIIYKHIYSNCSWLTGGDRQHPYRTIILFFIVKYVPGMVTSICVLIMLSNPFVSFWFLLGSLILAMKNKPLQIMRFLVQYFVERKAREREGIW